MASNKYKICVHPNCDHHISTTDQTLNFYNFPKDEEGKSLWLNALRMTSVPELASKKSPSICSSHFSDKSFKRSPGVQSFSIGKRKLYIQLHPDAIPLLGNNVS